MKTLFCPLVLLVASGISSTAAWTPQTPASRHSMARVSSEKSRPLTALSMKKEEGEYSRDIYLREEAESPFRKIRFFFYASLGGGALTSLAISAARIAAALNGINADLLEESAINAAVDLAGVIVLGLLFQRDVQAQESRLKRASKGAELAKLAVRCSKSIMTGEEEDDGPSEYFNTPLSSLRRGRGIEKRVVIVAAGKEKIDETLAQAKQLGDSLAFNDLLVVPVIMPQGLAPAADLEELPSAVALPVGNSWKMVVDDEAEEATKQGVDLEKEGFCIVLKKNGRVGQRTKGIFLDRMVGEVVQRRDAGLDVRNI